MKCVYKHCPNHAKNAIGYCSKYSSKSKNSDETTFQNIWEVFLKYRSNTVPYHKLKKEIISILRKH